MDNYIELALRTDPSSEQYEEIVSRVGNPEIIRLLHAFIGMATEVGEILDALKKHIFYGKELDLVNVCEEIGDSDWYRGIGIDALSKLLNTDHKTLDETIQRNNIEKLAARYPNKFTEIDAIQRDLTNERKILENELQPNKMIKYGDNQTNG
jgi:hypothetical protein